MIERGIKLAHITFQAILKLPCPLHAPPRSGVLTFANSTSVGIGDQKPIPNGLQHLHDGMVHYSIRVKRQNEDCALLGFVYNLCFVLCCMVLAADEHVVQFLHTLILPGKHFFNFALPALPP